MSVLIYNLIHDMSNKGAFKCKITQFHTA